MARIQRPSQKALTAMNEQRPSQTRQSIRRPGDLARFLKRIALPVALTGALVLLVFLVNNASEFEDSELQDYSEASARIAANADLLNTSNTIDNSSRQNLRGINHAINALEPEVEKLSQRIEELRSAEEYLTSDKEQAMLSTWDAFTAKYAALQAQAEQI